MSNSSQFPLGTGGAADSWTLFVSHRTSTPHAHLLKDAGGCVFFPYFLGDLISPPPTWHEDVWIMDPPPTGKCDPGFCGETPFYQLILKGCLYFS